MTARYRLDLAWDGSAFLGWQAQSRGRTVQGEITRALTKLKEASRPIGAGRTDAGVHALDFPAHVDLSRDWPADELTRALRAHLSEDVHLIRARPAPTDFPARFDARARTYLYALALVDNPFFRLRRWRVRVLPSPAWIQGELKILRESENVSALARSRAPSDARCRILDIEWRSLPQGAVFQVTADRFLYGMMRALCGTIVHGFTDGAAPGHLARVLAGEARARSAPSQGLYFASAQYSGEPPRQVPWDEVARLAGLGVP